MRRRTLLTVKKCVVLCFEIEILLEQFLHLIREIIGAETGLRCTHVILTSGNVQLAKVRASQDRVLNKLEERRLERRRQFVVNLGRSLQKAIPLGKDSLGPKSNMSVKLRIGSQEAHTLGS